MKTTFATLKPLLATGMAAMAILTAFSSRAGLNVPYTPDADTLHLWHFDGATNTILTTDEVQTASITLSNVAQTNIPGTTIALGAPAALGALNTALRIIPTNENTGSAFAFATATNSAATNGGFSTNTFCNTTTGAFTFEALVKPEGNPAVANGPNWEIICGDNSGGSGLTRGWQFRIQTSASPTLDFNFIGAGGGNFQPNLPTTGPDAAVAGQWYHVAVTYTGGSPTNGDTANVLTFYWTLLDGGRTNADVVSNFTSTAFSLSGTPVLGIGGSARPNSGVANGEGFKGSIDEVRISGVCRKANEMAFVTGGALQSPKFLAQPPTNTLIGYGQTLSLPALVTGSPAPAFSWYQNGTLLPSQTNSTLVIPNATFAANGTYQLFCSNGVNPPATSVVANVTIGAAFDELFATGVDNTGTPNGLGNVDFHYFLTHSADTNDLGPSTLDWNMAAFPIAANGGNFSNPDGVSGWLGPQANSYTSPVGSYTYRTVFLLDSVDTTKPMTLNGIWWVNEIGNDILLNGVSTGNLISSAGSSSGKFSFNFTLTNGFHAGINTLDFVTTRSSGANGSYQESAVRAELSGVGQALSAGIPTILSNPAAITMHDELQVPTTQNPAVFAVVAVGRPPLTYQWFGDNSPVTVAVSTNRVLVIPNPITGDQPVNYYCAVTDASGTTNSAVVKLTLLSTNQTPITPNYTNTTPENTPVNIDISVLWNNVTDPDGDPLLPGSLLINTNNTTNGIITQAGAILTYTPNTNFMGSDSFTYSVSDDAGQPNSTGTGTVFINVVSAAPPALSSAVFTGGNIVLSGSNGTANGTYHVLVSTNVALPLAGWTVLGPFNFSGTGSFSYTNAVTTNPPQQFFRIAVP